MHITILRWILARGRLHSPLLWALAMVAAVPLSAFAASPWENAVNVLQLAFTGPIARGLGLVSIVIGGLVVAYGETDGKRQVAGILFGVGMAIGATNFMIWLFP